MNKFGAFLTERGILFFDIAKVPALLGGSIVTEKILPKKNIEIEMAEGSYIGETKLMSNYVFRADGVFLSPVFVEEIFTDLKKRLDHKHEI